MNNFCDLKNLLLASPSFYTVYKANIGRVVTAITINECRGRGIPLTDLNNLSIAYLEFWALPPSLDLENAFRELLCREPQKTLILSLPQCTALRVLGGFRAWSFEIGGNGQRVLKQTGQGCDAVRTKRRRGYIHTEYGLLCCAEGRPVSTFKTLKAEYVRAKSVRARLRGVTAIVVDPFGQEFDYKHDQDAIRWVGKAMYFMARRNSCLGLYLCGICIVFTLGFLLAHVCVKSQYF